MITMLFFLLFWHALADFPLQGDYLAKHKNRRTSRTKLEGPDRGYNAHSPWWMHMSWHALIHAGGVALITSHVYLGLIEFVLHFIIDCAKIEGKISSQMDQWLHVACKCSYVLWLGVIAPWLITLF